MPREVGSECLVRSVFFFLSFFVIRGGLGTAEIKCEVLVHSFTNAFSPGAKGFIWV